MALGDYSIVQQVVSAYEFAAGKYARAVSIEKFNDDLALGAGDENIGNVDLNASEEHIGEVGGKIVRVSTAFTRPANTSAYAAGDVINQSTTDPAAFVLSNCARINGGSGIIKGVTLIDSANVSTKASLELWVFRSTYTADADNAVFTPTDAECVELIGNGVIPLTLAYVGDATSGAGGNAVYVADVNVPFVCNTSSKDLYFALVVRNGYTPVSGEIFTVNLSIIQN